MTRAMRPTAATTACGVVNWAPPCVNAWRARGGGTTTHALRADRCLRQARPRPSHHGTLAARVTRRHRLRVPMVAPPTAMPVAEVVVAPAPQLRRTLCGRSCRRRQLSPTVTSSPRNRATRETTAQSQRPRRRPRMHRGNLLPPMRRRPPQRAAAVGRALLQARRLSCSLGAASRCHPAWRGRQARCGSGPWMCRRAGTPRLGGVPRGVVGAHSEGMGCDCGCLWCVCAYVRRTAMVEAYSVRRGLHQVRCSKGRVWLCVSGLALMCLRAGAAVF